jgi:hypothetical protein
MGWNIRGFGARGRRNQLRNFLRLHNIDIIFLQESIKQDFTLQELENLEFGDKFFWSWLPASGLSGGLLLGIHDSVLEVGDIEKGEFFLSTSPLHKPSAFLFEFVGVYGPADHSRSTTFLGELERKVSSSRHPVVVSGDFNLIRGAVNKNNCNIDWTRVAQFNDCIARMGLRELARSGANFTWSNKQANPIRSVLDRVLVSPA